MRKLARYFFTAAMVGVLWAQTALRPMTLTQVLDEALGRNLRLLSEQFNITIGEARVMQARLRPNPVLSVGANYLDVLRAGFNPSESAAGPTEVNSRLDFLIEAGGKRRERIAVAEAAKTVAQLELANTTRSLILDIQTAFTDVLLAKENLALATESLRTFDRIVAVNRTRVDSGDLARVELARSEVAALQFRNQVRQAELRLRSAKSRLQGLMGRINLDPEFDVSGDMRHDSQPMDQADILRTALTTRPDLNALRRDEARSLAEVRLQLAQRKIDYTVGAGYNRQINVGDGKRGDSLGVFFSAALPLFNRNQGEIERARQEHAQIEARIRGLEQEITVEVSNAHDQFRTAARLLETIEGEMLDRSRRVREVIEFSYRQGEATFIDMLDAQRTLNETMQGFNEARAEYAKSLFAIDAITGKGPTP